MALVRPTNSAAGRGKLVLKAEAEVDGIGMGVLSDGTPYLNQRGLAKLCGVENAHIGTISSQWSEVEQKPRIATIKNILSKSGPDWTMAHIEIERRGVVHYCYPAEVCLAILEYYAFDAGANYQPQARDNFRRLAGTKLKDLIYSEVRYDTDHEGRDLFRHWHERIALNYQSAPRGFFHVFNEAHTIIYELVKAGANIGPNFVIDISIGQYWSKYLMEHDLCAIFGKRCRYPNRYPKSHPQAKSNPQDSWCYPSGALGHYREWLQEHYIEGGRFYTYLRGKVSRNELLASAAAIAIATMIPAQIKGPPT